MFPNPLRRKAASALLIAAMGGFTSQLYLLLGKAQTTAPGELYPTLVVVTAFTLIVCMASAWMLWTTRK